MPDDRIDLSDIREETDGLNWSRGQFYRPVRKQGTVRLDADVQEWFKVRQGGKRGCRTAMNVGLGKLVDAERRKG